MKPFDFNKEMDRIAAIPDPEQQGYEAAPMLCEMNKGCTPAILLETTLEKPSAETPDNALRDKGCIRWCLEQLEKQ